MRAARVHGGRDSLGAADHDFSTCANPLGPCPVVIDRLADADLVRYPDPASQALRERLATRHRVAIDRVLIAASASEFIQRITAAAVRLHGPRAVVELPRHGYGDYAAAAAAWGLPMLARRAADSADSADPADPPRGAASASPVVLSWWAEPSSPEGRDDGPPPREPTAATVLDAVYEPLRLDGRSSWSDDDRDAAFVLHGPNKALGLCGLRGAYAIAPAGDRWQPWVEALAALAPSWPLSAAGEIMLAAWAGAEARCWLAAGRPTLRRWRGHLGSVLMRHGFEVGASTTSYLCARLPAGIDGERLRLGLRAADVAVRDASSFGLTGWWRLSAQSPPALAALDEGLSRLLGQG